MVEGSQEKIVGKGGEGRKFFKKVKMGLELRSNFQSTVGWVKENMKIPRGDFIDGKENERGLVSTDAFGEIRFVGATRKARGKYIRLNQKTTPDLIIELLTKHWNLEQPKLLISVTGGAKSFNMDPNLRKQFATGLLKVAETPGAWVLTGGTNTGVMKHVGNALQGATKACIGIATWGIVQNRDDLVVEKTDDLGGKFLYNVASSLVESGAFLDYNHTHFLLVDDGSDNKFGREIPLRSALEKRLVEKKVPSVLLVLEGGPGTLGTVKGSLDGDVPVVIIKDSGRAADLLVEAIAKCSVENAIQLADALPQFDDEIMNMVKKTFPEYQNKPIEDQNKEYAKLYAILIACLKNQHMITMFIMDSSSTVDEAILAALLKRKSSTHMEQLKFTILWDRHDLAEEKILAQRLPNGEYWKEKELSEAMITALAMDRVEFVNLFLKYGISLSKIVDENVLRFLYGFCMKSSNSLLDRDLKSDGMSFPDSNITVMKSLCDDAGYELDSCAVNLKNVYALIDDYCSGLRQGRSLLTEIPLNNCVYRELFFWAVLNGMHEMAKYLWKFEEEGINKALIAAEINKIMAENAAKFTNLQDEIQSNFEASSQDFKDLAYALLDECHRENEKNTTSLITGQSEQFNKNTSLELAVNSKHLEFVSHSAIQALLDDIWTGSLKDTDVTTRECILSIIFPPYILKFDFRTESELQNMVRADEQIALTMTPAQTASDKYKVKEIEPTEAHGSKSNLVSETNKSRNYSSISRQSSGTEETGRAQEISFIKKMRLFYFETPVIKFFCNFVAYIVFLALISWIAMARKTSKMAIAEYVAIAFVFSFTLEEINQFFQSSYSSFSEKLRDYLSSIWNLVDIAAIVLYYIALGLRLNPSTKDIGHLFYALDAGIWILRLLHVFYAHRIMGPYVVMIGRMFVDMIYFLSILFVFLIAYGVVSMSILKPQASSVNMLKDITFRPYFNIYGELFIDRDPEDSNTTRFGTPVENGYGEPVAWALLALYLLVANVLLLNILIAIFGNTFQEVQSNAAEIWKFERYHLILEYSSRPPLVPPLIILAHIFLFLRWIVRLCTGSKQEPSGLKSNLSEDQREELNEFESDCVVKYLRNSATIEATDQNNFSEVLDKMKGLKKDLATLQERLQRLEHP